MKMPWLLRSLSALLVVVPATLAAIEVPVPDVGSDLRRRFCPGCYSHIDQMVPQKAIHPRESLAAIEIDDNTRDIEQIVERMRNLARVPVQTWTGTLDAKVARSRRGVRTEETSLPRMSHGHVAGPPSLEDSVLTKGRGRRAPCIGCSKMLAPNMGSERRVRFCPGCYTHIMEVPAPTVRSGPKRPSCPGCYSSLLWPGDHPLEDLTKESPQPSSTLASIVAHPESIEGLPLLEDSVLTEGKGRRTPCVGCFSPPDASKVAARAKREERRVASLKRRGKLPGTRPVCRGCFSGLMLTGRPAEGVVAEGTVPKSISESEENSSGGD